MAQWAVKELLQLLHLASSDPAAVEEIGIPVQPQLVLAAPSVQVEQMREQDHLSAMD
jgi:hypothetical protein